MVMASSSLSTGITVGAPATKMVRKGKVKTIWLDLGEFSTDDDLAELFRKWWTDDDNVPVPFTLDHLIRIRNIAAQTVEACYARWAVTFTRNASNLDRSLPHRVVNFTRNWGYTDYKDATGFYPGLGDTVYVYYDEVADQLPDAIPNVEQAIQEIGAFMGNTAAHELAHSFGNWGHENLPEADWEPLTWSYGALVNITKYLELK